MPDSASGMAKHRKTIHSGKCCPSRKPPSSGPITDPPIRLLQGDYIGINFVQHRQNAFRVAATIKPDGLVNIIAGEGELHGADAI